MRLPITTRCPYTTHFRSGVDVGEQDQGVRPQQLGHQGGQAVVVAEADLMGGGGVVLVDHRQDRKSTRLNSSHVDISYAVFCSLNIRTMIGYLGTEHLHCR